MHYFNDILRTIGHTQLVKLRRITTGVKPLVLAKCEFFNPGGSVKGRMAVYMVEEAAR